MGELLRLLPADGKWRPTTDAELIHEAARTGEGRALIADELRALGYLVVPPWRVPDE